MVDKLQIKTLDTINSLRHHGLASGEDEAVLDVAERVCRDAENAKQLLPKLQATGMQWEAPGNPIEQVGLIEVRLERSGNMVAIWWKLALSHGSVCEFSFFLDSSCHLSRWDFFSMYK